MSLAHRCDLEWNFHIKEQVPPQLVLHREPQGSPLVAQMAHLDNPTTHLNKNFPLTKPCTYPSIPCALTITLLARRGRAGLTILISQRRKPRLRGGKGIGPRARWELEAEPRVGCWRAMRCFTLLPVGFAHSSRPGPGPAPHTLGGVVPTHRCAAHQPCSASSRQPL